MTKTRNQIIFFFLHQNQNIFLEKNHNPVQVKWSFPYYIRSLTIHHIGYHNTHTGTSLINVYIQCG